MRDFIILLVHLIVTVIRLAGPKGLGSEVAESALLRHQLLILNRRRKRAPNLRPRIALPPVCSPFSWARYVWFAVS